MLTNKNFRLLLGSFTCIMGYFNLYGTVLNQYFALYNVSSNNISVVGAVANFTGIISAVIISIFVDKYKKYKYPFLVLNVIGLVGQILITISCEIFKNPFVPVLIFWPIVASSVLPIFSISMDFVCELTYPAGESISGGFIMTCNQISGIISVRFK